MRSSNKTEIRTPLRLKREISKVTTHLATMGTLDENRFSRPGKSTLTKNMVESRNMTLCTAQASRVESTKCMTNSGYFFHARVYPSGVF